MGFEEAPHTGEMAAVDIHAYAAAREAADVYGVPDDLKHVRLGPPSWVFADGELSGERHIVLRLTTADNTERLLSKTWQEVALLQRLRERGAQVQAFLDWPLARNGFVATISEYLPGAATDHAAYGYALATLHTAGTEPELVRQAPPFEPLRRTRQIYEYLASLHEKGETFHIGDIAFPPQLLPIFYRYLLQGEADAATMLRLQYENRYPPAVLQHDVHMGNVRADSAGRATLIDLDGISSGPMEYDLTRPIGQWSQRFRRQHQWVQHFLAGYREGGGRQPNPEILEPALRVSELRFATSLIGHAVESAVVGKPLAGEWSLSEGIRRLAHLRDPEFMWETREARA